MGLRAPFLSFRRGSFMFRLFGLPALIAFGIVLLIPRSQAAADSCGDCRNRFQANCRQTCTKLSGTPGFEQCNNNCIGTVCSKACKGIASKPKPFSCEQCVKDMMSGPCGTGCGGGGPHSLSCKKKCVAEKCGERCDLPTIDLGDEAEPDARVVCQECRDQAYERCAKSTNCVAGRAGYEGCRMACAVEQCASSCN